MKTLIALFVLTPFSFFLHSSAQIALNKNHAKVEIANLICIPKNTIPQTPTYKLNKITEIHGNLVAHSKYIFLEYVEIEETEFDRMNELTDIYSGESSLFKSYKLTSPELQQKYSSLLNTTVILNNHNREQFTCTIVDFVIVNDRFNSPPYLAAVTNVDEEAENIYYAWASSNSKVKLDEFSLIESQLSYAESNEYLGSFIIYMDAFQNMTFYTNFEDQLAENDDFYVSIEFKKYESSEGKTFVIVQNRLTGMCESLIDSQVALFELKNDQVVLCGIGSLDRFVIDLIDLDGDGFPEILAGDFSSSGIYKLKSQVIKLKSEFSWSFSGCPC